MADFEQDIKACVAVLNAGGTILYPTDTVWGIGCNALDEKAVDKVFAVKRRPQEKSLIILLADARDILKYVAAPHPDIIAIVEEFERPTTVIYEGAVGLADNVISEAGSVAIRVTEDPFCKALIKRLQKPLVSTSANISREPTASIYAEVSQEVKDGVDYIVAYRQEDTTTQPPSRLIKMDDEGNITVLRP